MNRTALGRVPRSLLLACLSTALVCAACNDLPKRRGATVVEQANASATLESRNPTEIVVVPVVDESKQRGVPKAELRAAFHDGLVKRRYSPLALGYVDQAVRGGAYAPGTLEEDAILTVIVESWDTTYWSTNDTIGLRAEVRMSDSGTGEILWSGRVDRNFRLDNARAMFSTERQLTLELCRVIADEVLAALPPRTVAS